MVIRRRSDAARTTKQCTYHDTMLHERANQQRHVDRQDMDPDHDRLAACWCCCDDCTDLTWYHPDRKGVWWAATPSSAPPSTPEIYAGPPGSAVTSTP